MDFSILKIVERIIRLTLLYLGLHYIMILASCSIGSIIAIDDINRHNLSVCHFIFLIARKYKGKNIWQIIQMKNLNMP
jgi:hypothetical protein